ncbi:MAG: rhodanese-like domain-containing protein [Pseudomonadota bacterium]
MGRYCTGALVLVFLTGALLEANALDLHRVTPDGAASAGGKWIVLDARPQKNWQEGHLPAALSFSWEALTRTDPDGVRFRIFPPEELSMILGSMGISHTDAILIYGDANSSWGGEGWGIWVLAWLGHQGPIYFLDGGIQAWQDQGKALTTDLPVKRPPATYQVQVNPDMFWTEDQVAAREKDITLIDTRGYLMEWLPGHLPGAIHIPWENFYQGKNRTALSSDALKALLEKNGVNLTKPVVYYCTGGIRSGYAWLVHELSGLPSAVNFEGGTEVWTKKRPLVR